MNRLGFDLSRNKELLSFFKQKVSKKNIFYDTLCDADSQEVLSGNLTDIQRKSKANMN